MEVSVHRKQRETLWTVRDSFSGVLLYYAKDVVLKNPRFVVDHNGLLRFQDSGRKLVYGVITGELVNTRGLEPGPQFKIHAEEVFFRPGDVKFHRADEFPVERAKQVWLHFGDDDFLGKDSPPEPHSGVYVWF